jgi:DnaJ-class molecular chaperone
MFFNFDNLDIDTLNLHNRDNYYTILGVKKTATTEEIKKAYRKLSLSFHPDRNGGDKNKAEHFSKLTDAYNILSDSEKRRKYDMELSISDLNFDPSMLINMMLNPNNLDTNSFLFNFNKVNNSGINSYNNTLPDTIFKDCNITLLQSYEGTKIPLNIKKWRIENSRKIYIDETIYVDIPKGIDNGEIIKIHKKGNLINESNIGDIEVRIIIDNDLLFFREGLDLVYKKDITLKQSLCGFSIDIVFLDGKQFKINNKAGNIIPSNFRKVIKDMGFEKDNMKGNLIILFNVIYPKELTNEQIQKLNNIL